MKFLNVEGLPPPRGAYSHAVQVMAAQGEAVYVSGQVAMDDHGTIPDGIEAQTALVFSKIDRVLAAAGLAISDIVKLNTFLISVDDTAGFSAVRNERLGDHRPASTLVVVKALANPAYLVEIEAVAVGR